MEVRLFFSLGVVFMCFFCVRRVRSWFFGGSWKGEVGRG